SFEHYHLLHQNAFSLNIFFPYPHRYHLATKQMTYFLNISMHYTKKQIHHIDDYYFVQAYRPILLIGQVIQNKGHNFLSLMPVRRLQLASLSNQVVRLDSSHDYNLEIGNFDLLWQDRKSTRLNSSHVSISYAVFCLQNKSPTCMST